MSLQAVRYDGVIDLRVRNNSHSIAFELIDQYSSERHLRILEVGCAGGYFGEALRTRGHEVWGVEPDPASAARASTRLDRVIEGTIDDFLQLSEEESGTFDVITFGDVLEHTADPSNVLRRSRQRLKPGGVVVASVPNVAHVGVRAMLLEGRWEYDERGILDRTHLRFFSKASLADLFQASGYEVDAIFPVKMPVESCGIRVDPRFVTAVRGLVRDEALDVFQYILFARPAADADQAATNDRFATEPKLRVLCLPPLAEWSVGDIRLRHPLSAWANWHGGAVRFGWIGNPDPADVAWANVVVLQREVDPNVLRLIDHWHAAGKYVVFDIDDLLTAVPEFLIAHQHSKRMRPHLEAALRAVDLVSTTTPRLAGELTAFNPSVFVAPNCPLPVASPGRHYSAENGVVLLFLASSDSVRVDFLVPALRRLMADPTLRLNLVGIGPPGKFLQEAGLPVAAIDNIAYEQFGNFLSAHDNAIGLIPLDDSRFSGCKSPIKFLDYSQAGFACVCSKVLPYTEYVEDGVTGLLVDNDVDAWCDAITNLARSSELRERISTAARRSCRERFSLRRAGDSWMAALAGLTDRPTNPMRAWTGPLPPQEETDRFVAWLRWAGGSLVRRRSYARAAQLLAREGLRGLARRVLRWR